MDKKFLLAELKKCKSVDEVLSSAKKLNYPLTKEEASKYFNQYCKNNEGALNEEELNNVAGGGLTACYHKNAYEVKSWGSKKEVEFIFHEGDIVQVYCSEAENSFTCRSQVVMLNARQADSGRWLDEYLTVALDYTATQCNINTWVLRDKIENK